MMARAKQRRVQFEKNIILSKLQRVNTGPLEGLTFGLERYDTQVWAVMHALNSLMTSAKQYKAMNLNGFHNNFFCKLL
jgi:hypothetical protein